MEPGGITPQAIKAETKSTVFFFFFPQAEAFAFSPPLGKLALAQERGKINKSNLKYALDLSYFWRFPRLKVVEGCQVPICPGLMFRGSVGRARGPMHVRTWS